MIKIGDALPAAMLMEYLHAEDGTCSTSGPQAVDTQKATAGKTIALFAVPGASPHLLGPACAGLRGKRGCLEGCRCR